MLAFWAVGYGLMFGANSTGWFGASEFFATDLGLHAELGKLAAAKYGFGGGGAPDPDQVWFFRLSPRGQGS